MKNRIVMLAVALLMSVSCSTDKPVTVLSRDIDVTVSGGAIKVSEEVAKANASQNVIKWSLDRTAIDAGYTFPDNGIAQDDKAAAVPASCTKVGNFDTAFHNCKPKQRGKEFHCNRRNHVFEADACYKYMVTLTGGSPVPPLDPWIKNE